MHLSKYAFGLMTIISTLVSYSFAMEGHHIQKKQITVLDVRKQIPNVALNNEPLQKRFEDYLSRYADDHVLATLEELEEVLDDVISVIKGMNGKMDEFSVRMKELLDAFPRSVKARPAKLYSLYEQAWGIDPEIFPEKQRLRSVKEHVNQINDIFKQFAQGSNGSLEALELYYSVDEKYPDNDYAPALTWAHLFMMFPEDYQGALRQKEASYQQMEANIKLSNDKSGKNHAFLDTFVYEVFITRDSNFHTLANLLSPFFDIPLENRSIFAWLSSLFYEVKTWMRGSAVNAEDLQKEALKAEKRRNRRKKQKENAKKHSDESVLCAPEKDSSSASSKTLTDKQQEVSNESETVKELVPQETLSDLEVQKSEPKGTVADSAAKTHEKRKRAKPKIRAKRGKQLQTTAISNNKKTSPVGKAATATVLERSRIKIALRKRYMDIFDDLRVSTYSETVTQQEYSNLIDDMVTLNPHLFNGYKVIMCNVQLTFKFYMTDKKNIIYAVHVPHGPRINKGYRPRYFGLLKLVLKLDENDVEIVEARDRNE